MQQFFTNFHCNELFVWLVKSIIKNQTSYFFRHSFIILKKENIEIPISVELCELEVLLDKITIEYILESEDAKNKIIITKGDKNE